MNAFTVARLHTRVRGNASVEPARLAAWQAQLAGLDGDALASRWTQPGEWLLIRRLPLALRCRPDETDGDIGRAWEGALAQAVDAALARGDAQAVRYADRRAALADLVYRSALGDAGRQWAWQRMGLIPHDDLPCADVLALGVQCLQRSSDQAWPVLMRLVAGEAATASLTAVLRRLPPALWRQWLAAAPRSAPYARLLDDTAALPPLPVANADAEPEAQLPADARALLAWAGARPWLAQAHRPTLAVLLAAIAWPAEAVPPAALQRRLAGVQAALDGVLPPRALPAAAAAASKPPAAEGEVAAPRPAAAAGTPVARQPLPGPSATPSLPAPPDLPEAGLWHPTDQGGALFWLARVGASATLQQVLAAPDRPDDGLRLFLLGVARTLGVPADDAALAAFCGGEVPAGEVPAALAQAAQALVAGWEAWLADAAPGLPAPRVAAVCARRGRLRIEPGWVELHLPLHAVDTAVRRLGLDLDPGWLPWLGCVLRICYDDD